MSNAIELTIQDRSGHGKGASRALRRTGWVPCIIYGGSASNESCAVERKVIEKEMHKAGFFTHVFQLTSAKRKERVIVKDVQFHPVTDVPLHIDFMRVSKDSRLTISIPVVCRGEDKSPGVKKGGIVNIIHHTLSISCSADHIPEEIVLNVEGKDIGHSFHASDLELPKDVTLLGHDASETIATIVAPTVQKDDDVDTASAPSDASS